MNCDFGSALRQLRNNSPTTFERAIFATSGVGPFAFHEPTPKALAAEVSGTDNKTKVIFITDSYSSIMAQEGEEQPQDPMQKQLLGYFQKDVITLFGKMIQAMGLKSDEFQLSAVKELMADGSSRDLMDNVANLVVNLKPKLILTIGASATNTTLGMEERLTSVHGKFFNHVFNFGGENFAAVVMPLFHPQLLLINPGMKRTAWADMQKGMKILGDEQS